MPLHCDAKFKNQIVQACCDALDRRGFTRFRKESVDWPLGRGFHCWVGLNTGLRAGFVEVSPFVGLHVVPIENLWTSLKQGPYPGKYNRSTATYARHLGELTPDARVFRFDRSANIVSETARLAHLYATVGLTFAKAISDYESLLSLLRQRIHTLGANPERYACCLHLMGRNEDARAFVNDFLPSHKAYFEGFSTPFLRLLDEDETGDCES